METSTVEEPPETPAHLFAIRAFKSALFGTPNLPANRRGINNYLREEIVGQASENCHTPFRSKSDCRSSLKNQSSDSQIQKEALASPTKGILLTPGTGTARRKTVSFRDLSKDSDSIILKPLKDAIVPSVQISILESSSTRNDEVVRKKLFRARSNVVTETFGNDLNASLSIEQLKETVNDQLDNAAAAAIDGLSATDVTADLKSPRSKSGQHWKREYQRDHNRSKLEMRKLIRYSQTAKSYAIKRDCEAIRLREKLKNAEHTLKDMEYKISSMASQLGTANDQGELQKCLLHDLATHTAQALNFKPKVNRQELALCDDPTLDITTTTTEVPKENGICPGAAKSSQANDHLSAEMISLREVAQNVGSRAARLESENATLKRTLNRVKEEMRKYEIRHQVWERHQKQKDERHTMKKRALQEEIVRIADENRRLLEGLELPNLESKTLSVRRRSLSGEVSNIFKHTQLNHCPLKGGELELVGKSVCIPPDAATFRVAPNAKEMTTSETVFQDCNSKANHSGSGKSTTENGGALRDQPSSIHRKSQKESITSRNHNFKTSIAPCVWRLEKGKITKEVNASSEATVERRSSTINAKTLAQASMVEVDNRPMAVPILEKIAVQQNKASTNQESSISGRTPLPPSRVAAARRRLEQRSTEKRLREEKMEKASFNGKENIAPRFETHG